MKRLFNPRKKSEGEATVAEQGNTLDRIVKDKEGVKKRLEEEEKNFLNKKKDYERKMIEFEKQEVSRREQEIAEKQAALEDMKRKNQMVQDKVQEQIKTLNMKLEELRLEHMTNEASSESIISCLNDKLAEVQRSLNERLLNIEQFDNHPSAPDDNFDDDTDTGHIYPSLQNLPTMPRSVSLHEAGMGQVVKGGNSLGSSPQISLASSSGSGSSRSNTPKPESDDTSSV